MNFIKRIFLCTLIMVVLQAQALKLSFGGEIQAFKKQDGVEFAGTHKMLFAGSPSFTKWKNVPQCFPNFPIINRGFGGSCLPDVIRYADDTILKYKPKQIVIYCGENDLAANGSVTPKMVLQRFKQLFKIIRNALPKVSIAFISIKPSPSRALPLSNRLINDFIKRKKNQFLLMHPIQRLITMGNLTPIFFLETNCI